MENNQISGSDQLNFIDTFDGNGDLSKISSISSEKPYLKKDIKHESREFPEMVLILDTETTGLDPRIDKCIEIGSILFHVESRSILAQQSFLISVTSNQAEKINKIPAFATQLPQPKEEAFNYFSSLVKQSDAIVAHNAEFDRKWFGIKPLPEINKPWICSMEDIPWPEKYNLNGRPSVRDLALSFGVPVWNAHRALTDCIYISEVFMRCTELEILLSQALEPRTLMKAMISYDQRHLAKKAGFRWNDPISGAWTKRLSSREVEKLEFSVTPIEILKNNNAF
mgnify:CR=1 FL=1